MEATESNLKVKLAQLQLTTKRTDNIIASGKHEAIQRQCQTLSTISNEINVMRITVEAEKIGMKVGVEEIVEWNNDIETKLDEADKEIEKAHKWIGDYKKKAEAEAQEEELKFQEKLHQTKLKYEAELQAAKSTQSQHEPGESTTSAVGAKLPKLVISKFNGTYMDWPRFWGQFTETIDKSNIAAVSKFAYLRELLDSKVKTTIEALPFTAEGYNRAKSILQEKYGKETEIVKAYCREILDLLTVTSANPRKIADFSDKLQYCIHALQAMKKLDQVNGAVALTLEKLPAIRGDIVRTDPDWECWNFAQLSEAIRLWTRRNPVESKQEHEPVERRHKKPRKLFHAQGKQEKPHACVYCDDPAHKAVNCTKVTSLPERRQILIRKRLCFNCVAGMHKSVTCPSKASCQHCHLRHHSSLHDSETDVKLPNGKNVAMTSSNDKKEGIFPVVVVDVNGIRCRALIDSGSGSSYVSTKLIQLLGAKPTETQTRTVDMLMASKVTQLEIYDLEFHSVDDQFVLPVRATKVNKAELLTIENPKYGELIGNYPHLKGVSVNDDYTKPILLIHVVLGSGEYAKIKTQTKPRIGQQNEPVAELTKFGWFVMSPGTEIEKSTMMLTQASQGDYEDLCRLDVLGLADAPEHDQNTVHAEFKEQLGRSPEGWYETGLPWKSNHPELLNNKQGSLNHLENLSRRLERKGQTSEYDGIIKEQIEMNIVERAPEKVSGKEFYIPHKPVVREIAATTKMRVVYDASAHPTPDSVSLNKCLNPGPPLQNKLWDVLVRQRAFPVAVNADLRRAFLQIRVKEADRDAPRFHCRSSAEEEVETWQFTRVLFGLAPSPFLLNGVLEAHLDAWEERQPDVVAELRKSLYVDDVISGNQTVEQAQRTKQVAIEIRAIHLELVPNMETNSFLLCLKCFIARRGRPRVIYSDNGSQFVKAAAWLKQVRKDKKLQGYLESQDIQWKFNLSRAPWWGGQFERLIGVVKQALYKNIGGATLKWHELSEVILDIEIQVNRRPLSYMEDDVEMATLTPSTFLFQRPSLLPDSEPWREEDKGLRKRAKFLKSCKDALWARWYREYLAALRERHNLATGARGHVSVGDVVIVKTDSRNRGKWPLAIVSDVYPGRDGNIRAVQLRTGKGMLERPIQHLYPLELYCDMVRPEAEQTLNPEARVFRPRRAAAVAAAERIKAIAEE